ncbi:acyl-CoA dehydrogenase family protein [Streptomyces clavuligerus]|uniref:Acyl-CoA dehydrogenase n=1 Tax=Streptomyces clavuligerus TaxID=1901 RepID=B5H1H1_STRCL|nr:acyl-CoA dehydrogenase family protein [Streptomyces clavuligerus]EDY52417.1 acyl-CoA dehydrogenase [Streptomyces clavuligerus]EFG04782.1 Acyl-CoA dehydrogenase [Streptomyces clavuligerus]MBY6306770.1 acyl-CoA dehydrogenase family protein [Streptomyces clavuligerus]QCS10627.1 acyl-CoA dehydrogenase [Streptomyces clavuligerus]QPJ97335.1 acyl-CoA dehydrogenase [Streptomyces clavuligerus]
MISWNADQNALREGVAQWCDALSEGHAERDAAAVFPREQWKLVQRSGILGLPFDERWGGLGQSLLTTMYVLEELGAGCRDGGLAFSVATHLTGVGVPLERFGSHTLKQRFLPGVCSGGTIGAHAITESGSGSDALAMRTTATRDADGGFVLRGSKSFVSNGPVADVFVVYARTHPDGGPFGISAFVVERNTPGLTVGAPVGKMGLRTSPLSELHFDDCRIPASAVLGRVGSGFLILDHVMKWEILLAFIISTGQMRYRLDRCVEYAKERTQFGQAIGSYQAISHRIVDMKIGLETSRKWLYDTAVRMTAGENVTTDISISKVIASESALASAQAAVQIFGGSGYLTECGLEKDLRDAVAGPIYSGTSEIQRNRVASMLGL